MVRKLAWLLLFPLPAFATAYVGTAPHLTMHVGDNPPPCVYVVTAAGTPTAATSAIWSAAPTCSMSVTSASPVGTYTITMNAGTLVSGGDSATYVNGTIAVIAADGIGASITNGISYPSGWTSGASFPALNVTSNGLANWVGDGVTDNANNMDRLLRIGRDTPTATCNVSGTALSGCTGASLTGITTNSSIEINGVPAVLASVSSSTAGTLSASGGTITGALIALPWWTVTCTGTTTCTTSAGTPLTGLTGVLDINGLPYTISTINSATSVTFTTTPATVTNADMYTAPSATFNYGPQPQSFLLPAGVYATSRPVNQPGTFYAWNGAGPQSSVIYLLPNSTLFQSGSPLISNGAVQFWNPSSVGGNSNFHEYLANIGIRIGAGNSLAVPYTTVSNNSGSIRNMQIWADDGVCPYAVSFQRAYPGPLLGKNVAIYGCANAISNGQGEYSSTWEGLTTEAQTSTVIFAQYEKINLRHWLSDNTAQALHCYGSTACQATILNSELFNGTATNAIQADYTGTYPSGIGSAIFVQNVTTTGYANAVSDNYLGTGAVLKASPVTQYWSGTAQTLFDSAYAADTLHLPVQETPVATDPAVSGWTVLPASLSSWASTISGSSSTTVYAPPGIYSGSGTYSITVPDTVNHINFGQSKTPTASGYALDISVAGTSSTPLVIDGCPYQICVISHTGTRTLVVNDATINQYTGSTGAGNLFGEDIIFGYPSLTSMVLGAGQNAWFRQLNLEQNYSGNKMTLTGATIWTLGYKTEQTNSNITLLSQSKGEFYGAFFYANAAPTSGTTSPINLTDSSIFIDAWTKVDVAGRGWGNWVNETQSGVSLALATGTQNSSVMLPMFYSYGGTTYPLTLNDGATVNANGLRGGIDIDSSYYDTNAIIANRIAFGTNPLHYKMQVQCSAVSNGGTSCFSYSQYAGNNVHQYQNGSFILNHAGSVSATGTVLDNTATSTTALTAVIVSNALSSITINTASLPGCVAGTWPLFIYGGGGSGAAATITCNGSATITSTAVTAGGSGYSGTPTVLIPSYFFLSTGSVQPGDSLWVDAWPSSGSPIASPVGDLAYFDWTGSYSNSGTAYGETTDLPTGAKSIQALVLDASNNASSSTSLTTFWDTGHQGGVNQVNLVGTWPLTWKAKLVSGPTTLNYSFGRVGGSTCSGTQTLTLGSWITLSPSCVIATDSVVANAFFTLSTSGQQKIEFTDVVAAKSTDNDPSGFTAQFITDMNYLQPGAIRVLTANAQAVVVYNSTTGQSDILNTSILGAAYGGQENVQHNIELPPIQLPMLLKACTSSITNGCDVTYPIPVTTTVAEAQCLADFMWDATGSTACGALRIAQGQTTPWGVVLHNQGHKARIALGNENWNSGIGGKTNYLSFVTIGGVSIPYAPYCWEVQTMASAFKAEAATLTGYVAGVTELGYGWQTISQGTGNSSYTYPCVFGSTSPSFSPLVTSADFFEQAPYTQYYNVNTWSDPASGNPTLQNTSSLAEVIHNYQSGPVEANAALYKSSLEPVYYETQNGWTGAGTTTNPTQAEINGWANGEGYGVYNALSFLSAQQLGYSAQHLFTYGQYQQTVGSIDNYIWGLNTLTPGVYRPTFNAQAVMNACIGLGSSLQTTSFYANPTFNFSGYNNVPANASAPYLYANLYKNGSNRCLILLNSDPVNSYTIPLSGTNVPSLGATSTIFNSTNLNDTSETSGTMTSSSTFTGTIPAHSITAISYTTGTPTATTPTFSPIAGSYGPAQSVSITASTGGVICYNTTGAPATNGSTGCTTGTLYTGSISVSSTETLYAVAGGTGYTDSTIASAAYTINGAVATPSYSPAAGTYGGTQSVTITTSTPSAVLCYTTDGSTPAAATPGTCSHGTTYSTAVAISVTTTLKAIGTEAAYTNSSVASGTYTITAVSPPVNLSGKVVAGGKVALP